MSDKETQEQDALSGMVMKKHQKPVELEKQDSITEQLGWWDIDKNAMPYKGMFYPEEWKIKARVALGAEVSAFSMMDPNDPLSVHEGMAAILKSCISITGGKGERLSWKNLYELDKIWLVMYVRDITMKKPENSLIIPDTCPFCKKKQEIHFDYNNMQFVEFSDFADKYFNAERHGFVIPTKSAGEIFIQPSNFYRAEMFKNFVIDNNRKRTSFDPNFSRMYWLFINDENQHDKKAMEQALAAYTEVKNSTTKFSIYAKIFKEIKVEPDNMIKYICPNESCGEEVHTPITFPDGLENIFIVSDIDSEFL